MTYHSIFKHLLLAVGRLFYRNIGWFLCCKCSRNPSRGRYSWLNHWSCLQVNSLPLDVSLLDGSIFGQPKTSLLQDLGSLWIVGIDVQDGAVIHGPRSRISGD